MLDDDSDGRRTPLASRLESLLNIDNRADEMPPRPRMPPANTPVLRWLSSWSRPQSRAGTPPPSTTPPSPSLASLTEALHEPLPTLLPTPPPRAQLPDSFHASRRLSHGPPFLDNLTRSTLPTSSLSPPLSASSQYYHPPPSIPSDLLHSPPIVLTHSPPTLSSLDTLRSVSSRNHIRSMSTSSVTSTATVTDTTGNSTTASWWWFQNDNKENVDTLLTEDDRAETIQEQQQNLHNKCLFNLSSLAPTDLDRRSLSQEPGGLLPRPPWF